MFHKPARIAPLAAALMVLVAGCGYQQAGDYDQSDSSGYQWHSLYRQDVKTVAAPIFTNKTFRRGVEFRLSKALINQLESQTPYKVVPQERADTILEGEIVAANVNEISSDYDTGVPQEQLVTLTVNFLWKDLQTGRILVERRGFEQTATYYPTIGEGEWVGSQVAVERLALAIVQELQADW